MGVKRIRLIGTTVILLLFFLLAGCMENVPSNETDAGPSETPSGIPLAPGKPLGTSDPRLPIVRGTANIIFDIPGISAVVLELGAPLNVTQPQDQFTQSPESGEGPLWIARWPLEGREPMSPGGECGGASTQVEITGFMGRPAHLNSWRAGPAEGMWMVMAAIDKTGSISFDVTDGTNEGPSVQAYRTNGSIDRATPPVNETEGLPGHSAHLAYGVLTTQAALVIATIEIPGGPFIGPEETGLSLSVDGETCESTRMGPASYDPSTQRTLTVAGILPLGNVTVEAWSSAAHRLRARSSGSTIDVVDLDLGPPDLRENTS